MKSFHALSKLMLILLNAVIFFPIISLADKDKENIQHLKKQFSAPEQPGLKPGSDVKTLLFFDDFESYTTGQQLVIQNPDDWTTWSNSPGSAEDPYVVDNGGNVVEITGTNDLVHPIPNFTEGSYEITFDLYIPDGADGYFNTLQEFAGTSSQWGMQVYFGHANPGEGNIDGGAALAQVFTFDYDTWMSVKVTIDLDSDWSEFYLDDDLIHGWQWSSGTFGNGNLNQLGGNNFYAWDGGFFGNPLFYIDNYSLDGPPGLPFPPVQNLTTFLIEPDDVLITWDEPNGNNFEPEGYTVYRDGDQIAYVPDPTTEYLDEDLDPGTYEYCVEVVYSEGISPEECTIITVPSFPPPLPVPTNLTIGVSGDSVVVCWDMPFNLWMRWDAGVNNGNGVGLTYGGTFSVASYWDPASLSPVEGYSMEMISFFANGDPGASYTLKVWTGADGLTELLSQPVQDFEVDEWNAITLDTPIEIIAANHLWFGYEVTHENTTQPAGCDDGPAIAGYGDMVLIDGEWTSLSILEPQLDFNWNLAAYVTYSDNKIKDDKTEIPLATTVNLMSNDPFKMKKNYTPYAKALEGFNVYYSLDGAPYMLLDFTEELCFGHEGAASIAGLQCYKVAAVYVPQGESDLSEEVCIVSASTSENSTARLTIYPNPAGEVVHIKSEQTIQSVSLVSYTGQEIFHQTINSEYSRLNIAGLKSGIYLLRVETPKETMLQRLVVE